MYIYIYIIGQIPKISGLFPTAAPSRRRPRRPASATRGFPSLLPRMGPRPPSPPQPAPLLSFLSPCGGRKQTGTCSFSADGDEDAAVEDDDGDESKEDEPSPFDVRPLPSVRFLSYLASLVPKASLRLEIIL